MMNKYLYPTWLIPVFTVNIILYCINPIVGLFLTIMVSMIYSDFMLFTTIGLIFLEAHTPRILGLSCLSIVIFLYILRTLLLFMITDKKLPLKTILPIIVIILYRFLGIIIALDNPYFMLTSMASGLIQVALDTFTLVFSIVLILDIGSRTSLQKKAMIYPILYTAIISGILAGIMFQIQGHTIGLRTFMDIHRPGKFVMLLSFSVLAIGYLFKHQPLKQLTKTLLIIAGVGLFYIVLISGSRMGLMLYFLTVTYSIYPLLPNKKTLMIVGVVFALFFATAVLTLDLPFIISLRNRTLDPLLHGHWQDISPLRIKLWLNFPSIIFSDLITFLLGHGAFNGIEASVIFEKIGIQKISHNIFLTHLIQSGITGAIFFSYVLYHAIKNLKAFNPFIRLLAFASLVSILGGLTEPVTFKEGFWLIISLSIGFSIPTVDKRTSVLHLIPHFDTGGTELLVTGMARYFSQIDCHVGSIIKGARYESMTRLLAKDHLSFMTLDKPMHHGRIKAVIQLSRYIETHRIDFVHTHGKSPDFYGTLSSIFTNRNLYSTIHNTQNYKRITEIIISYIAVGMIAISNAVSDYMQHDLSIRPNVQTIIYNGIDIQSIQKTTVDRTQKRKALGLSSRFLMLGVGRVAKQKNHRAMIGALKHLVEDGYDLTLLIIGQYHEEDPYYQQLVAQIKSLELEQHCCFMGQREDVTEILKTADIYLMPSLYEGMSLALMEAMAAGTPIVCTKVGAATELLEDGISAYFHEPDEILKIADAVKTLLDHPMTSQLMASKASKSLEKYDIQNTAKSYERLYISDDETF